MKYIIELEDMYVNHSCVGGSHNAPERLYRVKGFNSLVFDDAGLRKLEKAVNLDNKIIQEYESEIALLHTQIDNLKKLCDKFESGRLGVSGEKIKSSESCCKCDCANCKNKESSKQNLDRLDLYTFLFGDDDIKGC